MSSKSYLAVPGVWKFACAMAVLIGHNLVTVTLADPSSHWTWFYRVVQFFSPLHFFFFSGFLAAPSLMDPSRRMGAIMASRGIRVYALVVVALVWGLAVRWIASRFMDFRADSVWPVPVWSGGIDGWSALWHLSPVGFADHTKFNYATWYLYQELRIVLLFPVLAWLLRKPARVAWIALPALIVFAAVLENRLWMHFPTFRSSPFQTLAYGAYFLAGAVARRDLSRLTSLPIGRGGWLAVLVAGVAVGYLESFGIQPPVKSPPVLLVQTLVAQLVVVVSLSVLLGKWSPSDFVKKFLDWSVGIYVMHPPVHVVSTWVSLQVGSFWPLLPGMAISVLLGAWFHRIVETPLGRLGPKPPSKARA